MAETMEAWQYSSTKGGIEKNLKLNTAAPIPTVGEDQVLVQIHAMALNPVDYKMPEAIPGVLTSANSITGEDFAGKITKLGSKVSGFNVGDWVFGAKNGERKNGTMAQYTAVKQGYFAKIPEGVKVEDAAAVGIVGLTEIQAIKPNVKSGDRVFINGGSGGTGSFGVQIAKALGCHVTTSCSTANVDFCKSLGADEVIDYRTSDIVSALKEKGQFSLVVDNIGTPANLYLSSPAFLPSTGKFAQIGAAPSLSTVGIMGRNFLQPGFLGGGKASYQMLIAGPNTSDLQQLGTWLKEGKIKVPVDSQWDWKDVPKAFEKQKEGRAKGKIIIKVPQKQ